MQNVTKSFDYHQPDMSVNRSVYASCLSLDSVIGQLKGQLTRRACVSGQNALCACAVLIFHICRIALSALYTTGPSTITDQIVLLLVLLSLLTYRPIPSPVCAQNGFRTPRHGMIITFSCESIMPDTAQSQY